MEIVISIQLIIYNEFFTKQVITPTTYMSQPGCDL